MSLLKCVFFLESTFERDQTIKQHSTRLLNSIPNTVSVINNQQQQTQFTFRCNFPAFLISAPMIFTTIPSKGDVCTRLWFLWHHIIKNMGTYTNFLIWLWWVFSLFHPEPFFYVYMVFNISQDICNLSYLLETLNLLGYWIKPICYFPLLCLVKLEI